jgi:hypothetical protein
MNLTHSNIHRMRECQNDVDDPQPQLQFPLYRPATEFPELCAGLYEGN